MLSYLCLLRAVQGPCSRCQTKHLARHASRCPSASASLAPLPATGTPAELPIRKLAEQPPVEHTLPDACPECTLTSTLRFANKKNKRKRPFSERDVTCSSCSATYAFCVPCRALFKSPDSTHLTPPQQMPISQCISDSVTRPHRGCLSNMQCARLVLVVLSPTTPPQTSIRRARRHLLHVFITVRPLRGLL